MVKEKSLMNNKIKSNRTEQLVAIKFVREFENACDTVLHDPSS